MVMMAEPHAMGLAGRVDVTCTGFDEQPHAMMSSLH
jgi:hypothetical protein